MSEKIGFIGCGNMGSAMVGGLIKSGFKNAEDIIVSTHTESSLKKVKEKNNVKNGETIGCIILKDVFFFDKLIEEPSDWKKSIVRGKSYTLEDDIGKELYLQVNKQLPKTR